MGIFNHISKLSNKNIQRTDATFEVIFSDYAKKEDLLNYDNKSIPITTTNLIDMGGNRITALADPTEDTDGINRSFFNKRISTVQKI